MSTKINVRYCLFFIYATLIGMNALHVPLDAGAVQPLWREWAETLTPENGLDRGNWGPESLCGGTDLVKSFSIKYDLLGKLDDTAANGLLLYCYDENNILTGTAESDEGSHGNWKDIQTCPNISTTLIGVRLEVLPSQGTFGDDIGVNNVQMFCSDYTTLDGLHGPVQLSAEEMVQLQEGSSTNRQVVLEDGRTVEQIYTGLRQQREDPVWGQWLECSAGYSVCGLQTRVEPEHSLDDDAGLVDALLFCC